MQLGNLALGKHVVEMIPVVCLIHVEMVSCLPKAHVVGEGPNKPETLNSKSSKSSSGTHLEIL